MVNKFIVEKLEQASAWGFCGRIVNVETQQPVAMLYKPLPADQSRCSDLIIEMGLSVNQLNNIWYSGYKAALQQMGLKDVQ